MIETQLYAVRRKVAHIQRQGKLKIKSMKKKDHVGSKVGGEDGWGRETGGEKIETTYLNNN